MRKPIFSALLGCAAPLAGLVWLVDSGRAQSESKTKTGGEPTQTTERQASGQSQSPRATRQQTTGQDTQTTGQTVKGARPPAIPPGYRLLTLTEGSAIAQGIAWADDEEGLSPDCSHLVHKLYDQAGYPYPYASSLDLYRGTGPFLRVQHAHPGDLVVWLGHVGIVLNPKEHSFFSAASSGTRIEDYRSAYWRGRGYPHFFRYLTKSPREANGGTSEAANRQPHR